jgi:hypothetical protein
MNKLPNLIPPFRFSMVEETLFRGGYPKPRNKRFLKRYKEICIQYFQLNIVHLQITVKNNTFTNPRQTDARDATVL